MLWPSGLHLQLVGLLGEMEMRDVSYIYNNKVMLVGTERGRECWPPPRIEGGVLCPSRIVYQFNSIKLLSALSKCT